MLTYICESKRMNHNICEYFKSRLGYLMALFNILVQWHGFEPNDTGFVPMSIAEFSL